MPASKSSTAPAWPSKGSTRRRPSRVERGQQIRESLFDAAIAVVGRVGYANAMISMIASEANVAHGTFYNYFDSRQDLFDNLLPTLGEEMLRFIGEKASGASNGLEREERSFRAFFTFLKVRPEFYRILYEAELFAPKAFRLHTDTIAAGFVRTLEREFKRGELRVKNRRDLEAVAFMLMGARHYLCMRFARRDGKTINLPEWVVRTYMDLVVDGLYLARQGR